MELVLQAKRARTAKELHDDHVAAMWLMFLRTPGKAGPELDGSFSLGEIGEVRHDDQKLLRETPYSVCTGRRVE